MNPTVPELLAQGLLITVIGMGLVFAALALLWALIQLLNAIFSRGEEHPSEPRVVPLQAAVTITPREEEPGPSAADELTAERARVAAQRIFHARSPVE